jgi:hypothetical protein
LSRKTQKSYKMKASAFTISAGEGGERRRESIRFPRNSEARRLPTFPSLR